ncbi:hypothetical protein [Sphingobium abikonense]|uniref:hypothetical protein n=1 Tax=Sphingobium abikonense TaxID=86193 RepID=UPI00351508DE
MTLSELADAVEGLDRSDEALLLRMPIRNAGDDPEWPAIMSLFNRGLASLYWNVETGERGMDMSESALRALRARAALASENSNAE